MKKKTNENVVFAEERRIKIAELLQARHKVTAAELNRIFGVSAATTRNDLRAMQKSGLLVRTHGGAIEKTKTGFEPGSHEKEGEALEEKRAIAAVALGLIENGDTIILDTGTTTLELAGLLRQRQRISVITNDILIARKLEDIETVSVVLMGGILRKGFHCTVGTPALQIWSGLNVDKAFLGTNSLSVSGGATTPDISQAETKKAMMSIAAKVIILCDSRKLGKVSFAKFAAIDQIDTIIIDSIDNKSKRQFEDKGVEVVIAGSIKHK